MQRDAKFTAPPRPPKAYWLVVRGRAGRTDVLTLSLESRKEALAVFGYEEEAEMFSLWASGEGWRPKKIAAGNLAALLSGPYADVGFVALDPTAEMVSQGMAILVSLGQERFVDRLIEETQDWGQRRKTRHPSPTPRAVAAGGG